MRKVRVLRQVEVKWEDLKEGDIFSMESGDSEEVPSHEKIWKHVLSRGSKDGSIIHDQLKIIGYALDNLDEELNPELKKDPMRYSIKLKVGEDKPEVVLL